MSKPLPSRRSLSERNALIVEWQYLPRWVAKQCIKKGHPGVTRMGLEDAADAGMFGLIRAAELWDERRGILFKTYAVASIWAALTRNALHQNVIHIPSCSRRETATASRKHAALQAERIHRIDQFSIMAKLLDRRPSPLECASTSEDAERVNRLLARLPARTRKAIQLKFQGFTLAEVGQRIGGITKERARQIIETGLERCRKLAGV